MPWPWGTGVGWLFPGIVGRFNGSGILNHMFVLSHNHTLTESHVKRLFFNVLSGTFFCCCSEDNGCMFFLKHWWCLCCGQLEVKKKGTVVMNNVSLSYICFVEIWVLLCCKVMWCNSYFLTKNEELDLIRWQSETRI